MTLFNRYMAVDWSATNSPKRGKDSIWVSGCSGTYNIPPFNITTRSETISVIKDHITATLESNERLLIGFDFAFGYPAQTARTLGGENWADVWRTIHELVKDDPKNRSNRFHVADEFNKRIGQAEGPFWGHPHQHSYKNLSPKKPKQDYELPKEYRLIEKRAAGAKSVWQLAYNGAVGSQTLLGIAALETLRRDPDVGKHIAIWPFQTCFAEDLNKSVVFAEIYPSSHEGWKDMPHDIPDAQQVAKVCQDFKNWDNNGLLASKMRPENLSEAEERDVLNEEGWIIGRP
ncbi:hypothetical protein [Hellea balneolensis]|uniref:hypothetical protein n=1 Tax=Hellea balneolensis TaxID=287478 RepID=UPI0003F7BFBE|nr:hypothetical protein [Hellea balneolensis]